MTFVATWSCKETVATAATTSSRGLDLGGEADFALATDGTVSRSCEAMPENECEDTREKGRICGADEFDLFRVSESQRAGTH